MPAFITGERRKRRSLFDEARRGKGEWHPASTKAKPKKKGEKGGGRRSLPSQLERGRDSVFLQKKRRDEV